MRVNPNISNDLLNAIWETQQEQQTALEEMSTGKRVNVPSDDPGAAAAEVDNQTASAQVDQYTQNVTSVLGLMQASNSAISSVVEELNQAISIGTQGSDATMTTAQRQALAQQLQGVQASVLANANSTYEGNFVFAGTSSGAAPFAADSSSADGYTYNGNSGVNSVGIGEDLNIQSNMPGNQLFMHSGADVLGSLKQLYTALESGTGAEISSATTQVTSALNYLSQQQVFYSSGISQLQSQETSLQTESVNLQSQQTALIGVDMAQATSMFTNAQTAYNAALAAAAKVLPQNLLEYLN